MRVAIIGSEVLDFKPEDVYRYARNVVHPHTIDTIVTFGTSGVADTAKQITEDRGMELRVYDTYREAIADCDSAVIFRSNLEYPTYAKYCSYVGRPFKEYVVYISKDNK